MRIIKPTFVTQAKRPRTQYAAPAQRRITLSWHDESSQTYFCHADITLENSILITLRLLNGELR